MKQQRLWIHTAVDLGHLDGGGMNVKMFVEILSLIERKCREFLKMEEFVWAWRLGNFALTKSHVFYHVCCQISLRQTTKVRDVKSEG